MLDWNNLFPELEWITDGALREKVALTWDEACRRGGWGDDEIGDIPARSACVCAEQEIRQTVTINISCTI